MADDTVTEEVDPNEVQTDMDDKPPKAVKKTAKKAAAKKAPTVSRNGKRMGRPPGSKTGARKGSTAPVNISGILGESFQSMGTMIVMAGAARGSEALVYDGKVIHARGPDLGRTIADIAEENPAMKATIERMLQGSSWAKVAMTFGTVVVPIAAAHGVVPTQMAAPFVTEDIGLPPAPKPKARRPAPVRPEPQPTPQPVTHVEVPEDPTANGAGFVASAADASGLPDA